MKKILFISLVVLNGCLTANGQVGKIKPNVSFWGKWHVNDWILLFKTEQTKQEKAEFYKKYRKCLTSVVLIDSMHGISVENNACEFDGGFNHKGEFKSIVLPIVDDTYDMKRYPGQEIVDSNVVGKTFIKLLDKKYKKKLFECNRDQLQDVWDSNAHLYCKQK